MASFGTGKGCDTFAVFAGARDAVFAGMLDAVFSDADGCGTFAARERAVAILLVVDEFTRVGELLYILSICCLYLSMLSGVIFIYSSSNTLIACPAVGIFDFSGCYRLGREGNRKNSHNTYR
jgi:hypothetical protein